MIKIPKQNKSFPKLYNIYMLLLYTGIWTPLNNGVLWFQISVYLDDISFITCWGGSSCIVTPVWFRGGKRQQVNIWINTDARDGHELENKPQHGLISGSGSLICFQSLLDEPCWRWLIKGQGNGEETFRAPLQWWKYHPQPSNIWQAAWENTASLWRSPCCL